MDSILTTIKKMLGITSDYTHFDTDIIVHINTVLLTLRQIGINISENTPYISSEMDTWNNVFGERKDIEAIKTYIYLKVRLAFDPPTSSFVLESMNKQANELEWRLNVQIETSKEE